MTIRMIVVVVVSLICLGGVSARALAQDQPNAGTRADRFVLHSKFTNDDHVVRVWVPRGYQAAGDRSFPLLLLLDGEYSFEAAVPIADYLQRTKEVKEFIVAAVSYDVGFGPPLAAKRSRDYTPPVDGNGVVRKAETNLHRALKEELLPNLRSKYRIDQNDETLWSYSLSGSFAAWLDYVDPTMFDHHIVASGNLIDYGIIQKLFAGEIFKNTPQGDRKVILTFDVSEIPDPSIVKNGQKMLDQRGATPGNRIKLLLTKDESHTSSWFASLPASLRFIYGSRANEAASRPTTMKAPR